MRIALSILLLLHGIAHLPGFLVSWRLMQSAEVPYSTTVFGGSVDVGNGGIRLAGLFWLVAGLAGVLAAAAAFRGMAAWPSFALGAIGLSIVLCLSGWPVARIGLALNGILLVVLLAGTQLGWLGARTS